MLRIIVQVAGHVNVRVQVDTHHGLELPQGQDDRAFCVIDGRDSVRQRGLGAGEIQFRGLLGVEAALDLLEVREGVLVGGLIHVESLLGQQAGEEGLLDLVHRLETGTARLLDGQLDVLAGDLQVFPQLGIHQRHAGADAGRPGIPTADFESVGAAATGIPGVISARAAQAAHAADVEVHVHDLLLDGTLVRTGPADLRVEGSVRPFAGIARPFYLHVRHFDGRVLAEGDPQGILEGEDRRRGGRINCLCDSN